jgi:hypothetical protein
MPWYIVAETLRIGRKKKVGEELKIKRPTPLPLP